MTDDQLNRFDQLFKGRQLDIAYEVVAEAIQCDETDWNALYLAGVIHRFKNDYESAIRFYKLALSYNSQDHAIWQALGVAHQFLRQFPEAIDALKAAIQLNPNSYESYNSLGITYKLAGDYTSAIEAYEQAREICASHAFAEVRREHPEYFRIEQGILHANHAYMEAMRQILVTDFKYFNVLKNMITCCTAMNEHKQAHELQEHVDTCTPIDADIIGPFR
jgi:tetratricopeptide (TPR) repeat protein